MNITIPALSLVILVGISSSGKSTFAKKHFLATEIISSDHCRALVSDDENNQAATQDAFDVLHLIAAKRLKAGLLTVIDATNVQTESRKSLIALARHYHYPLVAIVLDLPEEVSHLRHTERPDRNFDPAVLHTQYEQLQESLPGLAREGFRHIHTIQSVDMLDALTIKRKPFKSNKQHEQGPLDIIGDVHGCFDELLDLLKQLGYEVGTHEANFTLRHPEGRKVVFAGDLVDRGPDSPGVVKLAMAAVQSGTGYCVAGNHDIKLVKALRGYQVRLSHGLQESMEQFSQENAEFRAQAATFLDTLTSHYVFDNGKLVVAHAGLKEEMHGRESGRVREFATYGETTGKLDEYGLPIRLNWAANYHGQAMVVYGHTPVQEAEWLNNTICLDTGCVFGGQLTALRYPEKEVISVPARRQYYEKSRPFIVSVRQSV